MADETKEPILVRAAKGLPVERPPAWMMRQAGRYMQEYRDLAVKHPSFRERSETTDLITEITLQPWRAFQPDGVILFSDILTPLPALGIPFEIDDYKGPILETPIRDTEGLKVRIEAFPNPASLFYLSAGDCLSIHRPIHD
jgi:uroporphyrinogen decarboxylase|tara:strand:- start:2549 stop:2971 length:423 start_codon:yes stop_codon:yes gene_type:complete